MASEQASGLDQDIASLLSSLECDMTVQAGVLKQYAKMHDAVKALVQEKVKTTHEKQEVERLQEELSNKDKELRCEKENVRGMNQLLSRENHQLSVKNEKLSHENKELTLKLKEKLVHSGHAQGVSGEMKSMCTWKILFVMRVFFSPLLNWKAQGRIEGNNEPKEELFDQVLSNRIIAEDCERRRELSEIRKKLVEVFGNIDHHRQHIRIKMMGQINDQAFLDAAHSKHPNCIIARDEAVKNCSVWQKKIEDPFWHPYKMITEDGPSEEVLNDEDETLKKLKACGKEIYEAVTEALKEMDDYNRSGRSVVPELWNYKEGRKATVLECVEYLGKKVKEQSRKKRKNNPSSV
ncbi:hypothetical protein SEVIR_7G041600v4 [Setaria viridis]|uniref:Factor of DNA methylation 1-5/IDN2 domain-containing protein n=1 Tax=Setaria viridis TaxID=4556 RepID=A0A4U6TNX7_SETVI|nr:factor of DNA methylation 4-like [Setaria viridis]TKW03024.1 hypothetical protein SEVIR_7G041600v2 [Setaria viridis]